ncbi:MAG TPA: hypothetical protein VIG47_00765, partial [Gemmatimonadaceae bacterium]
YMQLVDLLRVRARVVDDIVRQAAPYFVDDITYDPEAVAKQWKDRSASLTILSDTRDTLSAAPSWDAATLEAELRGLAERHGIGGGKLFQPLRVALTGLTVSPGIFDVLVMQGRERAIRRLERSIEYLSVQTNG